MQTEKLWTTFFQTGSVVDYLNYKNCFEQEEKKHVGENVVESNSDSNRDDTFSDTHGRV